MNTPFFPIITKLDVALPFHIVSVGQDLPQSAIKRPDGMVEYQWLHVTEGEGILIIENRKYKLVKGMGFFMFPNIPHEYYPTTSVMKTSYIVFDGYGTADVLRHIEITNDFYVFYANQLAFVENLINNMISFRESLSPNRFAETSVLLYSFIIQLGNFILGGNTKDSSSPEIRLEPVLDYMQKNYMNQISIDDIASHIDITASHLCRLFKQAYKIRPFEYINILRIEKSKEIMSENLNMPLKQVADKVGFNSLSYFCTVFNNLTGYSPKYFKMNFINKYIDK